MEVSVAVEGSITKTNAAFVNSSKNGVTLMMMDVGKLIEDDKYREQLAELSRAQEVAEVKEKLKNMPYMKIEFADIVYVNFN
jgi:replicative DNA helicase